MVLNPCTYCETLSQYNNACMHLALQSSALKGMAWSAFMVLKGNFGFEK